MSAGALPVAVALRRPAPTTLAVGLWLVLIAGARVVGERVNDDDPLAFIGNSPLIGAPEWGPSPRIFAAVAAAAAVIAWGPSLARRLRWLVLLAVTWAAALAWPVLLAWENGSTAISQPLGTGFEPINDIDAVGSSPGAFLAGFADQLPQYAVHTKGHPPGMVLVLWALDRLGLGGQEAATVAVLVVGAVAAPAALVALRALAGENRARAAAPFLVFAPTALWIATSTDALYSAVATAGIALFALACTRQGPVSDGLAVGAGTTLGAALFLTYGAAPLAVVVSAIAAVTRRPRPFLLAGAGVAAVFALFLSQGFWWFDGLSATREAYASGVAAHRPHDAFLIISLAAFAVALGPAVAAALPELPRSRAAALSFAGLAAVLVSDASGLSKGETERIWLIFAPWLLLATAWLPARTHRPWLAAQASVAILLQISIRSPW